MKLVEMTCPNCGGDLKKTSDTMAKCSHCGAEFEIDRGQPENVTNVYENTSQTKTIIVGILAAVLIGGFIAIAASSSKTKPFGGISQTSGNQSGQTQIDNEIVYSRFFRDFTKAVFNKEPQDVTENELSSITYLNIGVSSPVVTVRYSMNDDKVHRVLLAEGDVPYGSDAEFSQDLGRFTNLHTFCDYYTAPNENTLSKLENLTELRSDNSPEELVQSLPHPENLTTLYCRSGSNPSLAGIEAFTNLTELSISGYTDELNDISGLGALTHLKSLSLEAGEVLSDFGVLQSLTELEELNLKAEKLKELSFLKSLTHLKKLTIKEAVMLDISPIGKLKELTDLCLEDNNNITDFKALSGLSGLKTLTIQLPTNVSMPSVKKWKHLTRLTVINGFKLPEIVRKCGVHILSPFRNWKALISATAALDWNSPKCPKVPA
ncbi:MAG: hypothetical protein MR646_06230 [Agathobacter sp.]|nr:hypothetical protein [Agathobacter sp.]MDY4892039.1 hypothetical protein [Agathobacter sp.]